MEWKARWIWIDSEKQPLNKQACFRKTFEISKDELEDAVIHISADSCFWLYVNGKRAGSGPIRSTSEHWYYESCSAAHLLREGSNTIAVQVWHYGHSNYQYVENRAGMALQLDLKYSNGITESRGSDSSWKAHVHEGYKRNTVKRNVNIGWLEVYDARSWDDSWTAETFDDSNWPQAHEICQVGEGAWGTLYPRDIEPFACNRVFPRQLVSVSEVKPLQMVVSLNMREMFFPGSRDANVKIFSGFFGTVLELEHDAAGKLSFAHSPWNGVQGRFRIDDKWYKTGDELRLTKGRHLFMTEAFGVYNDVISHLEWDFKEPIRFIHPFKEQLNEGESPFVVWGPFQTITSKADGYNPVYGGVEKRSGLDRELPAFAEAGKADSLASLEAYKHELRTMPADCVIYNEMIYSLMHRKELLVSNAVRKEHERLLYDHEKPAVIELSRQGGDQELVLDFGKLYVGEVTLELQAAEGTVIDVYGFEAIVNGSIRYTSGLNNAFRYTARGGRQTFRSVSRMGFRYLMLAIRQQTAPVSLYRVYLEQSGYPAADQAQFRCSDPLLNDIWEISRHTSEVCTEDTFVDCPTFERVFWVGDCRVSALVNYYLFGSYELVRHCLEMVPRSSDKSPLLLSSLPTDWQSVIPMWTFSWMIAIKDYAAYSGDRSFEASIYPEYAKALDEYCKFLNRDDLFDISSWNLVDWADMDIPYVGVGTAQHGALAYCCSLGADMAERLGKQEDAAKYRAIAAKMRAALKQHLWIEKEQAFIDGRYRDGEMSKTYSHQTHVLLYLFEALDGELQSKLEERLLNPPEHWISVISPFMSFYLFDVWQRMGKMDRIIERIKLVWGAMVRQGSTTAWETYPNTRSFAHAWSAAPCYVLGKHLLGVKRLADGFASIEFELPVLDSIDWAEGSIPTPFGRIDAAWSREDGKRQMIVTVPEAIEVHQQAAEKAGWQIEIKRVKG
ncbi:family 78 glycoside hydrolase catalytic domain [Paenibacillus sp. GXUN7292]|uniref:family 78 glycoside hydrolase catalytic domain n=1 Tax=Paenibacillus sp. GXUN7292 TaxID=3422499 RepID=UPI003D7E2968